MKSCRIEINGLEAFDVGANIEDALSDAPRPVAADQLHHDHSRARAFQESHRNR